MSGYPLFTDDPQLLERRRLPTAHGGAKWHPSTVRSVLLRPTKPIEGVTIQSQREKMGELRRLQGMGHAGAGARRLHGRVDPQQHPESGRYGDATGLSRSEIDELIRATAANEQAVTERGLQDRATRHLP